MNYEKRSRTAGFAALLVALAATACSSSSGGETTGGNTGAVDGADGGTSGCIGWTGDLETYTADMVRTGDGGTYKFELTGITPGLVVGNQAWTLSITDANGQPVTGATFTNIKTWMPQHGHPSTALPMPVEKGGGVYEVDDLYLYMAGIWQVTFVVKSGTSTDQTTFTFCLVGD
jgi:YtkA-like